MTKAPSTPSNISSRSNISTKAIRFAQREKLRKKRFSDRRKEALRQAFFLSLHTFPWWLISSLTHLMVFFFCTHLFFGSVHTPELYVFEISWEPSIVAFTPEEKPALTPEPIVNTPPSEVKEPLLQKVPQEIILSVPKMPSTPQKILAVPEKNLEPEPHSVPKAFQNRLTGKAAALEEYGGGANTESAVKKGLDWLARHQSPNGSWNPSAYTQRCLGKKCDAKTSHANHSTGLTGLALLCFLGAGETPTQGIYQKKVSASIHFLLTQQKSDGSFGPGTPDTYNQAIATLALIETYSMTGDELCKNAGQNAIFYLAKIQQAGGGWDYYDLTSKRNDTSITGWVIMALQSARYAQLEVSETTLKSAKSFLHCMYNHSGSFYYNNLEEQTGAGMTGVGALCLLYLEEKPSSLLMQQSSRYLQRYPPNWLKLLNTKRLPSEHPDLYNYTLYAWYYGTLCLFHLGGEPWTRWNEKLKNALLANQQTMGCKEGSWDPVEAFFASSFGGRLYATTLNLLTLEIYYRYLPLYRSLQSNTSKKIPDAQRKK